MAAKVGRAIALTWKGTQLNGVQEKGITFGGEPIDVTSDENLGWREQITARDQRNVDIAISGVDKDSVLRDAYTSSNDDDAKGAVVITYPDTSTIIGNFIISEFSEAHPVAGASTFQCTLRSTGEVTFT